MTNEDKAKLFVIIRDHLNRNHGPYIRKAVEGRITEAHNGRPDGHLVTTDNMYLFRQYRNSVSPSATHMVDAALAWKEGTTPLPQVGDVWEEDINQGARDGVVVAVDAERGQYLWEYEMPKGTTALVLYGPAIKGGRRTVSYGSLSDRWLRMIEEQNSNGLDALIANPQTSKQMWFKRLGEYRAKWPAKTEVTA
jgi:hypothetical protein